MKKTKEDFPNLSTAIDSLLEDDVDVEGKLAKIGELLIKNHRIRMNDGYELIPVWVEAYYNKKSGEYKDPTVNGAVEKTAAKEMPFGRLRFVCTKNSRRRRVDIVFSEENYVLSFLIKGAFRCSKRKEHVFFSQTRVAEELNARAEGLKKGLSAEMFLIEENNEELLGEGELKLTHRIFSNLKNNIEKLIQTGADKARMEKVKYMIKQGLGVYWVSREKIESNKPSKL